MLPPRSLKLGIVTLITILMMVSSLQVFDLENLMLLPEEDNSIDRYYYVRRARFFNFCSEKQVEIINSSVDAKGLNTSPYAVFVLKSIEYGKQFGVTISGERSKRHICFDKRSKLITRLIAGQNPRCIFQETFSHDKLYTEFHSLYNETWKIGFNRKGKPLFGSSHRNMHKKNRGCFYFTKRIEDLHKNRNEGPKFNPNKYHHLLRKLNHKTNFESNEIS